MMEKNGILKTIGMSRITSNPYINSQSTSCVLSQTVPSGVPGKHYFRGVVNSSDGKTTVVRERG